MTPDEKRHRLLLAALIFKVIGATVLIRITAWWWREMLMGWPATPLQAGLFVGGIALLWIGSELKHRAKESDNPSRDKH